MCLNFWSFIICVLLGVVPSLALAEEDDRVTVFRSVNDMFNDFPMKLRPHPERGWDKITQGAAEEWFKKHLTDAKFESRLTVSSVLIGETPKYGKPPDHPWLVKINVKDEGAKLGPVAFILHFQEPNRRGFTLYGNESFAKRAGGLKKEHFVGISGTISSFTLAGSGKIYHLFISLKDFQLSSTHLKK